MIEGPPRLGRHDVGAFLEQFYKSRRSDRTMVALYGTGERSTVTGEHFGTYEIRPVASELQLRAELPDITLADDIEDPRIAFLVPWPTALPIDLSGRFSRRGKVFVVGKELRIQQLFAVQEYETAVQKSPLVNYLLAGDSVPSGALRLGGGRLSLARMWETWLKRVWSVYTVGGLALDTLLGWSALDEQGGDFLAAMERADTTGRGADVRAALLAHLRQRLGPGGALCWCAWERGCARAVLEYAILFEVLAGSDDPAVRLWLKQSVRGLCRDSGVDSDLDEDELLAMATALGDIVGSALHHLERVGQGEQVRALVNAADERVQMSEIRAALVSSQRLPSTWQHRLDELGDVLVDIAADQRQRQLLGRARGLLLTLAGHASYKDEDHTATYERAEMAVRLAAWLVSGSDDRRDHPGATPYADVESLGRWYVEDGGFVDWARR